MPREILRFPYSTAELVLLEYPDDRYEIDIYWRDDCYYERLIKLDNTEFALSAIVKVIEIVAGQTHFISQENEGLH